MRGYIAWIVFIIVIALMGYSMIIKKKDGSQSNIMTTLPSGLQYAVLKEAPAGSKQVPQGSRAQVHYTGWLYDPNKPEGKGTKFDSSVDRGRPFVFSVGSGMVIRGWDEGVGLMKVGEKRLFVIPPSLGYGAQGIGGVIPSNATLLFEVEVMGVQ